MKKILKDKFSSTTKLVRKMLSKPSSSSHESRTQILDLEEQLEQENILKSDMDALNDQISNLKGAIISLQCEAEEKDVSLANLTREKEKMALELLKTKRSNISLAQQLEDERHFYFKKKELYCHEMHECKKLKRFLSQSSVVQNEQTMEEYRSEISKLKLTLNQTLEANYNLSIKFLRMKNTKTCLKTELQRMKLEHEKLVNDYKTKIENLTVEINDLVNDKLNAPISPSSKKYLQLVKQNGCLVYENLCLQLEVDNLNFKLERIKLHQNKSATNEHLKYIHHRPHAGKHQKSKEFKKVSIHNETPEKLEREESKPCCSKSQTDNTEILKIYERKESPGVPNIKIVHETKSISKKPQKKKKEPPSKKSDHKSSTKCKNEVITSIPDYKINVDDNFKRKIANNTSKITLFQVSNVTSTTSGLSNYFLAASIKKTRSLPNILNSTDFQK